MPITKRIIGCLCIFLLVACSNEQIITKDVNISDLDKNLQTWVQNNSKEIGIYIKKIAENNDQTEDIRYLVYSRKELSYDYRTTTSKIKNGTLSIYLSDKMASNDQYVKKESLSIITLKTQPKKIEMYLNDKTANYKMEP